MKALLCYGPEDFRIEDIEKPSISGHEMLIETIYTSLCGSDIIRIFDPNAEKPAVYGHEVVGKVVETGKYVDKFKPGDQVVAAHHIPCYKCHYCSHGNYSMCSHFKGTNLFPGSFSQYIRLTGEHIDKTTFKLPQGQDLREALFTEPLACCIRAMERATFKKGDIFTVVGTGAIGSLFIQLVKLEKCRAVAIDPDSKRLELAREFGADFTINPSIQNVSGEINKITSGAGIDTAILTVTNSHTLNDALAYLRDGGEINLFGASEKDGRIEVDFQKVYKRELTIKSSYSAVPETVKKAFRLITGGKIRLAPLVSDIIPLSDFKKGMDQMLEAKVYKTIFKL